MGDQQEVMRAALDMAHGLIVERMGIVGFGIVHLMDGDGRTKQLDPFANLITTAGDEYCAKKIATGIGPAAPSAPTAANGMKLGTGTTAVTKSSTAAALITYLSASNVAFDSGFATTSAVGGDAGWYTTYKTSWLAGVATNSAITEVAIVNDQATNATSTAANTYSRAVITSVNKTASDVLAITWNWKALGA
jgi:hypothetical protein